MKTARFWTGTAILTGLVIAIRLALAPAADENRGLIEGMVTYQGQPVGGGTIALIEDGAWPADVATALIHENGRFEFDTRWKRPGAGPRTYRIVVTMNSDWIAPPEDSRDLATTAEPSSPSPRVIRAALESPERATGNWAAGPRRRHPFSNRETTNLRVRLGPGAARVDVDLED